MTGTMAARKRNEKPSDMFRWRLKKNITQREAAELLGVSFSTYRRLELLPALPRMYALAFQALKKQHPA